MLVQIFKSVNFNPSKLHRIAAQRQRCGNRTFTLRFLYLISTSLVSPQKFFRPCTVP
jgi:hypothetical protein